MLLIADILRALKHHMLKEMGKTRFANFLAGRTHMIGHIHMHQRIGTVFMQHDGKTIIKDIFFKRDNDIAIIGADRFDKGHPGWKIDLLFGAFLGIAHFRKISAGGKRAGT